MQKKRKENNNIHTGLCWGNCSAARSPVNGLTTNRAGVSDYWLRQSGRPQRKTDGRSFVCLGNSTRIGFELACAPAAPLPVFFPPGAVFLGPQLAAPEAPSLTRPPADALRKKPKQNPIITAVCQSTQPFIVSSSLFLRLSVTSLALALRPNVGALCRQL